MGVVLFHEHDSGRSYRCLAFPEEFSGGGDACHVAIAHIVEGVGDEDVACCWVDLDAVGGGEVRFGETDRCGLHGAEIGALQLGLSRGPVLVIAIAFVLVEIASRSLHSERLQGLGAEV